MQKVEIVSSTEENFSSSKEVTPSSSCTLCQNLDFAFTKEQRKKTKWKFSLKEIMIILGIGDIILLFFSVQMALLIEIYINEQKIPLHHASKSLYWLIIPWILFSIISDSYNPRNLSQLSLCLKQPISIAFLVWMVYFAVYFFSSIGSMPRLAVLFFGVISCVSLMLWRLSHFWIFSQHKLRQRILIVGQSDLSTEIKKLISFHHFQYELVSVLPNWQCDKKDSCDLFAVNFNKIVHSVDKIIVGSQNFLSNDCWQFLLRCRQSGISLDSMSSFYEKLTRRTPVAFLDQIDFTILPLQNEPPSCFYSVTTRAIDIVFGIIVSLLLLFLLPWIAIAIKASSPGPIFFSQMRIGKNGKPFRLWKFRTMIADAINQGPMWTEEKDKRVTWIGNMLRKLHLDELPQIWNLLKGDLTIVGIRPLSVEQCEKFEEKIPFHNLRHIVKPGLTGWAVVNFYHVNNLEGAKIRLEYDLYYVKYQNLWMDFLIFCRTVWTILTMNGL